MIFMNGTEKNMDKVTNAIIALGILLLLLFTIVQAYNVTELEQEVVKLRSELSAQQQENQRLTTLNNEYRKKAEELDAYNALEKANEKKKEIRVKVENMHKNIGSIDWETAEKIQNASIFLAKFFQEELLELSSQKEALVLIEFEGLDLEAVKGKVERILEDTKDISSVVQSANNLEEVLVQESRLTLLESEFEQLASKGISPDALNDLMQYCDTMVRSLPIEEVENALIVFLESEEERAFIWNGLQYSRDFLLTYAEILSTYPKGTQFFVSCSECYYDGGGWCHKNDPYVAEWAMPMVREILNSPNCEKEVRGALIQSALPWVLEEVARHPKTTTNELDEIFKKILGIDIYGYGYCSYELWAVWDWTGYPIDGDLQIERFESMQSILENPNCSPQLMSKILERNWD